MSGKPWTPERRAAFSKQQKLRWRDPALREAARQRATKAMADPTKRAQASARMKRLNEQMRSDAALKKKCVRGMKRVRREPSYRAMQALVMKDTMSRPENAEKARRHACEINRDPEVRRRQWAGKVRNGTQPKPPHASKQKRAERPPRLTGDALFVQLLALEARKGQGR